MAVQVMAEAGVDISQHTSKHWEEFLDRPWDLVVTVCDDARESCPVFPAAVEQIHVAFSDPTFTAGSDAERLAAHRAVRDEIRTRLLPLIAARG